MKLTFPYMGPILVYKKLLEMFGHEVVMPLKPTQRTFDLGTKYSPEFLCFPFKCVMGTYIEAMERGAEGVVTTGGDGSCRAGFYAEVHRRILKSLGWDVPFYVFDSFKLHPRAFLAQLSELKGSYSWAYLIKAIRLCYAIIAALDRLQARIRLLRPYEQQRGAFARLWDEIQEKFYHCSSRREVAELERAAGDWIAAVPRVAADPARTVRIGIVGEIYVAMEGHANMELEEFLAALGVEVLNSQYVSHWLDHKLHFIPWKTSYVHSILDRATPYLKIGLGGHDKENIAHMIAFREQGADGIIHLMPFACLPELVTQSIIPRVSKDLGIPILSIALDEQRGLANNHTRIEAFIDLVRNTKKLRAGSAKPS